MSAWYCSASSASAEPPIEPAALTTAATRLRISGYVDDRFEDVGRALRIADQHQARRPALERHGHDRVADLARVGRGARQRIDLEQRSASYPNRRTCSAAVPGACSHFAKHSYPMPGTSAATRCRFDGPRSTGRPVPAGSSPTRRQRLFAGPVVGKLRRPCASSTAQIDLAKTRALVLQARVRCRARCRWQRRRVVAHAQRHAAGMSQGSSRSDAASHAVQPAAALDEVDPVENLHVGQGERTRAEEQHRAQAIGVVPLASRAAPTPVTKPSLSSPPEYIMSCTRRFLASSTSACSSDVFAASRRRSGRPPAARPARGRPACRRN